MNSKIFFKLFFLCFFFTLNIYAQFGFQIGADGTSIFNPNPNTTIYPFTPIMNYEMALVNKATMNQKLSYKVELGYANKGAMQSTGPTTKSFAKNSLGYLYGMLAIQYEIANDWNIQLAVAPSYLVLYKKYDNGNVQNYITTITRNFRVDVPIAFGISRMVGKLNEFTIRYAHSTAPFASQKNVFPVISTDKFYNMQLGLIYTFYLPTIKTRE
jgi:hypothetical protein